jgi:Kinesin motor domain
VRATRALPRPKAIFGFGCYVFSFSELWFPLHFLHNVCSGMRATEAKSINLSLTMLGMCINARADPNIQHVPFRDSKLTRLLQVGIGGCQGFLRVKTLWP